MVKSYGYCTEFYIIQFRININVFLLFLLLIYHPADYNWNCLQLKLISYIFRFLRVSNPLMNEFSNSMIKHHNIYVIHILRLLYSRSTSRLGARKTRRRKTSITARSVLGWWIGAINGYLVAVHSKKAFVITRGHYFSIYHPYLFSESSLRAPQIKWFWIKLIKFQIKYET